MANLYTVAGQHFFIGQDPMDLPEEDLDESDFSAVVWVEVHRWSQMGALGDAAALITTPLIDVQRDIKQKGTRNAGSMQNNFAIDLGDAGQQAMIAAEAGELNWPFKVVGNDAPASGSSPAPSERKFVGLVTTAQVQGGGPNTAQLLACTVEVNSNIVVLAPQSGTAPANVLLPSIAGVITDGDVLTAIEGVWNNGVDSYAYQWKADGSDISGATSKEYTLVTGDVGAKISVVVTATNGAGSTSATSAATDEVGA